MNKKLPFFCKYNIDFNNEYMKKFFQVLGIVTLLLVGLYYIEECSGKKDQSEAVEDVQDDLEMEKSVHLKFKGVPIDGTLKEFISRMERKGFEHRSSYDSKERLVGDFAGIKQCTVYVETLDNSDLVSRIIVEFPKQERWEELFDNYKNLKSMLMEKYGNFSCQSHDNYHLLWYSPEAHYEIPVHPRNNSQYESPSHPVSHIR